MTDQVDTRRMKTVNIGDIQTDKDTSEWVVVAITHLGVSRVRKDSLAHRVHAKVSPEIAKSLSTIITD